VQMVGLIEGARKVVRVCARIASGEKVAVVTDTAAVSLAVAEALAAAASEVTPDVVTTVMTPREVDGDEPPAVVAAALAASDVALLPVSYSISHSAARRSEGWSGSSPLSTSAFTASAVSQTGEGQGW